MQYKYVEFKVNQGFLMNESIGHREIIEEMAKDGYKYLSYIPTVFSSHGEILEMDLVFIKE